MACSTLASIFGCAVVFRLAAAAQAIKSDDRFVQVGAKDLSVPKDIVNSVGDKPSGLLRTDTPSQWFGAHLVDPAGKEQKKHSQHQKEHGSMMEEAGEYVQKHLHHGDSLAEGQQQHKMQANAGIPILQAARTTDERDSWPRDIDDPEPGDGFEAPRDVENNPGDSLLEGASAKKSSFMRREHSAQHESDDPAPTPAPAGAASAAGGDATAAGGGAGASTCEQCKTCKDAIVNQPDNTNHTDGVWCMCNSWDEWSALTHSAGIYDGAHVGAAGDQSCTECKDMNATVWSDLGCEALNCSCDLNVFWNPAGSGEETAARAEVTEEADATANGPGPDSGDGTTGDEAPAP